MPIDLTPTPSAELAAMTDVQKQRAIVRRLLELTDENGRGYYPLEMLAFPLGMTAAQLYDNDTNTGLLWDFGQHGKGWHQGALHFLPSAFDSVAINRDVERETEAWANAPEESEPVAAAVPPAPAPDEPTEDVQCSEAALAAAEEINLAWRWDIPLSKVGAIIDRHFPVAAKFAEYEGVLRAIARSDTLYAVNAREVLRQWGAL